VMERLGQRLSRSLFPAESDKWVTALRIGLGLQVLFYALSLRNDWNYLFAGADNGLMGRSLSEGLLSTESPIVPRLGWLLTAGQRLGLSEWALLSIAWWSLLSTSFGLLGGVFSRASAILAWALHLCAAKSGGLVSYGVDNFMTIGLFYLMLSPLPDRFCFDQRWKKSEPKDPHVLGFWRRVLQLHLCLIYFFGGLTKCLGNGWWDGTNIWRSLIRPPFNIVDPAILVRWKIFFPMVGVTVCLLETGYPFLMWRRRTRLIWLGGICAMHTAIGLLMGMYLFALVMIILNVAAFGVGLGREKGLREERTKPETERLSERTAPI
jgi:Vitamin K-dependent gamma-carboxylase